MRFVFFRWSRETWLPQSKNIKNNKINSKLIFVSQLSYLAASPGIFHLFLQLGYKMTAIQKLIYNLRDYTVQKYPIKRQGLKSTNKPDLVLTGHSKLQMQSFFNDAARIWNLAPNQIKECKSIGTVKQCIKTFVKTLPIWYDLTKMFPIFLIYKVPYLREINIIIIP